MYDFDKVIAQCNTQDEKHDQIGEFFERDDLLPMWVAEMDFETAPEITRALIERVQHGIFGYTYRSESYQKALLDWYARRHHVTLSKEMIAYDTGVLKAIFEMLRIFSKKQDRVCVPVPAYPQFAKVIKLAEREMVRFPLCEHHHRYEFDFQALDEVLQTCSVMILCSPHNPGGRIWTQEELENIATLCMKHHVLLICDEIHCDLTLAKQQFISILTIDSKCIVMNSISKPFNLAGLQHSYSICQDIAMRTKIADHYHRYKIKSMNTLSMLAQEIAYTKGEPWLEECCAYIQKNDQYIREFLLLHDLHIPIYTLQAGYLCWMDFSYYFDEAKQLDDFLVNTCHIATSHGSTFDASCGLFTRLNIATQTATCEQAINRIYKGLQDRKLSI